MTSLEQFLKTVRIFSNLTQEELGHLIPLFEVKNVKNKDQVIHEGDEGDLFYIIRSGHFSVSKGPKDVFITVLGPREYFGEASLFHEVRRTATVTATEDAQILILNREQFQQYLLTYPMAANRILFQMLKDIFFRLEETSNDLLMSRGNGAIAEAAIHKLLR